MVETLKEILGLTVPNYDFIVVILAGVIILFTFKYTIDLFAYVFRFGSHR